MEELARTLKSQIDKICVEFHYFKKYNTIERSKEYAAMIQEYVSFFLQGNNFGISEEEYKDLYNFSIDVLKDYMAAVENEDAVLMVDTLEHGLRELLKIFIDEDNDGGVEDGE